jgi:uracil-DNA glycosylase
MELLGEITACPNVARCLDGDSSHPCFEVVRAQGVDRADHQVPEPWNGHLERAPMLVLGMNPAYNPSENAYPTETASGVELMSFFEDRFRDSNERSRTWLGLRRTMDELLGRPADPGIDFSLTEVVRCKSNNGVGVRRAAPTCTSMYLQRTLSLSPAPVIVALGAHPRRTLSGLAGVSCDLGMTAIRDLAGRDRLVVAVGHPTGPEPRRGVLTPSELDQVRRAVIETRAG